MPQSPATAAVRNRLFALSTCAGLAFQVGPPDRLASVLQQLPAAERARLRQQLDEGPEQMRKQFVTAQVWQFFTAAEQRYLSTPPDRVSVEAWSAAAGHIEGVGVLMWALELLPCIPPYDEAASPDIIQGLSAGLPAGTALRSGTVLNHERDIAELWHWRARARLFASGVLSAPANIRGDAFEAAVEAAAERAAADGVIAQVVGGDFPIGGQSYASLPAAEVMRLATIAQGRHLALNWLCGLAPDNRWEDSPSGT